jgi:hypothetical protein
MNFTGDWDSAMASNRQEKNLILKINRRLAAASAAFGFPLHMIRTQRQAYSFGNGAHDLWNVETNKVIDHDIELRWYDHETRFKFRFKRRSGLAVEWLKKKYGLTK